MFALRYQSKLLRLCAPLSTRKSYEFEDLLQSSAESSQVNWYHQSRLGLTRTLSEENVYEDIIGKYYIPKNDLCNILPCTQIHKLTQSLQESVLWRCFKTLELNFSHKHVLQSSLTELIKRAKSLRYGFYLFFCNLELCRSAFIKKL